MMDQSVFGFWCRELECVRVVFHFILNFPVSCDRNKKINLRETHFTFVFVKRKLLFFFNF